MPMAALGKYLIVFGLAIAACGLMVWCVSAMPIGGRLGRLPGDIYVRRANFTCYFPIATSIVVSVVLSLLVALLRR